MTELQVKLGRVQELLKRCSLEALLLKRSANFAWLTCGAASHVNVADSLGAAALLITAKGRYVISDNIEAPRLQYEEHLADQGWEFRVAPWYEQPGDIQELTRGSRLGADFGYPGAAGLSDDLVPLRAALTPEEGERFRRLGRACAHSMQAAILRVRPGQTELRIAAALSEEALVRGVDPIVDLVAVDERISSFRHPLPTSRQLNRYAMLILCGRQHGLVCSITRIVHFGAVPDDLRRKTEAVALVDAHFIAATRPGAELEMIFAEGQEAYRASGFAGEWKLHHQGGLAGYAPREIVATPHVRSQVLVGQAYAWNPSITGTKSEDTILVGDETNELLTSIADWPSIGIQLNGRNWERPAILEVA